MRTVKVIFKIDLVNVLLGFSQIFLVIPIMNLLSWFMMYMKLYMQLLENSATLAGLAVRT